jgi:hypothetical protein
MRADADGVLSTSLLLSPVPEVRQQIPPCFYGVVRRRALQALMYRSLSKLSPTSRPLITYENGWSTITPPQDPRSNGNFLN